MKYSSDDTRQIGHRDGMIIAVPSERHDLQLQG